MPILSTRPLAAVFCLYWAAFWLLNALDRFCCRTDYGMVRWFGNDRVEKFTLYFERLAIPPDWVPATLTFAGVWEYLVAVPFMVGLIALCAPRRKWGALIDRAIVWGIGATVITFTGFSAFDVVVGDRAELWEHGTYVALAGVAYVCIQVERAVAREMANARPEPVARPDKRRERPSFVPRRSNRYGDRLATIVKG